MLPATLATLTAYNKELAAQHVELKTFVQGDSNRILDASRSELVYPVLWQETPALVPRDNGAGQLTALRECGTVILVQVSAYEDENAAFEAAERMALDVLSRYVQDGRLRQFGFSLNDVKIEPVSTLFVDDERGWRIGFPLEFQLDLCYDPTRWHAQPA